MHRVVVWVLFDDLRSYDGLSACCCGVACGFIRAIAGDAALLSLLWSGSVGLTEASGGLVEPSGPACTQW